MVTWTVNPSGTLVKKTRNKWTTTIKAPDTPSNSSGVLSAGIALQAGLGDVLSTRTLQAATSSLNSTESR